MGRDSGIVVGDVALSEQHKGLYPYNELGIYSTFFALQHGDLSAKLSPQSKNEHNFQCAADHQGGGCNFNNARRFIFKAASAASKAHYSLMDTV
ncbi:hypothetical protein DZS_49170 [Dickeya ananatis]